MITQSELNNIENFRSTVLGEVPTAGIVGISTPQLQLRLSDFFAKLAHDIDNAPTVPPVIVPPIVV